MTWTWHDLILAALVDSGLQGRGQSLDPVSFSDGKQKLSFLLDELDGQGLLPQAMPPFTFNSVPGQAKYYLGVGSNSAAISVRPERILAATVTIAQGAMPVNIPLQEIAFGFPEYQTISVQNVSSQPWHYAINPAWPQAELYLYPVANQVYPITITMKAKWSDTITTPDIDAYITASLPSGYNQAIGDMLALRLAEKYRQETPTLQNKAQQGRMLMLAKVAHQVKPNKPSYGVFPWVRGIAGVNA